MGASALSPPSRSRHLAFLHIGNALIPAAVLLIVGTASGQSVVSQWPSGAGFAGGLDFNETTQEVWVADASMQLLDQYDRAGNLLGSYPTPGTLPVAVGCDPATNTVWLGDEGEVVYEIDGNTGLATGFSFSTLAGIDDVSGLAFDTNTGTIWITKDSAPQTAAQFDTAGNLLQSIDLTGTGSTDPDGLAFNPLTNTLFLGDDQLDRLFEVDLSGTLLNSWDMGALGISPEGVGLDLAAGEVILCDGGFGANNAIVFFVDGIITAGPSGPSLTATGAPGGTMTFDFGGFAGGEIIAVVYGPAGSFSGNIPCGSVTVDLTPLNYPPVSSLILRTADANGDAQLVQAVPGGASGLRVQGVGRTSCGVSNFVTL